MAFNGMGAAQVNREFFTIKGRHFVKVAKKPTSEAEAEALIAQGYQKYEYTTKEGEIKSTYEMRFPNVTGQIIECFEREGNFAIEQCIVIQDENGEQAQIAVNKYMNSQLENLMNRMCNEDFDPNTVVKLVPYSKPKGEGKTGRNEGVLIYALDDKNNFTVKIEKAFKAPEKGKQPDHDCPSWESEKKKGKVEWNNDATMEYLSNAVAARMTNIQPADFSFMLPETEEETPNVEGEEVEI